MKFITVSYETTKHQNPYGETSYLFIYLNRLQSSPNDNHRRRTIQNYYLIGDQSLWDWWHPTDYTRNEMKFGTASFAQINWHEEVPRPRFINDSTRNSFLASTELRVIAEIFGLHHRYAKSNGFSRYPELVSGTRDDRFSSTVRAPASNGARKFLAIIASEIPVGFFGDSSREP